MKSLHSRSRRRTAVGTAAAIIAATVAVSLPALADSAIAPWHDAAAHPLIADPNKVADLTLYSGSGAPVTSGSINQPLAAFAASSGQIRSGDDHGVLYLYTAKKDSPAGAFTGLGISGAETLTSLPGGAAAAGPVVPISGSDVTLADYVGGYPNSDSDAAYADDYELRLRTSSNAAGVSDTYAAAVLKVDAATGTWKIGYAASSKSTAASTTTVTAPGSFAYGTAASITVKVSASTTTPTGSVTLAEGSRALGGGTLASDGTAKITVAAGALQPGAHTLSASFTGSSSVKASTGSAKVTVTKSSAAKVTYKATKAATSRKVGKAVVTVAGPAGATKPSGTVTLVFAKGKKKITKKVKLKAGSAKIAVPKLAKGTWKITIRYGGDARYTARAAAKSVKVKK